MLLEIFLFCIELLIGYAYPFFASFCVISKHHFNTINLEEGQKWCFYWISLAALNRTLFPILDCIAEYYLAVVLLTKIIIMGYLALPYLNGSMFIYKNYVISRERMEVIIEEVRINLKTNFEKIKLHLSAKKKIN